MTSGVQDSLLQGHKDYVRSLALSPASPTLLASGTPRLRAVQPASTRVSVTDTRLSVWAQR